MKCMWHCCKQPPLLLCLHVAGRAGRWLTGERWRQLCRKQCLRAACCEGGTDFATVCFSAECKLRCLLDRPQPSEQIRAFTLGTAWELGVALQGCHPASCCKRSGQRAWAAFAPSAGFTVGRSPLHASRRCCAHSTTAVANTPSFFLGCRRLSMSRIKVLLRKLQRSTEAQRANAVAEISSLAQNSPENCAAIEDAGGVPALVRLLDCSHETTLGAAAAALGNLARNSRERSAAIAEAGGIEALVRLLHSSSRSVLSYAAAALVRFVICRPESSAPSQLQAALSPLCACFTTWTAKSSKVQL